MLVLDTIAGTSTTDARAKGFTDELAKYPEPEVARRAVHQQRADQAAQKVTATLSARRTWSASSPPTSTPARARRPVCATRARSARSSWSASTPARRRSTACKAGSFQALIAQDPATIGKEGVDQAVAALTGGSSTRDISTNATENGPNKVDPQEGSPSSTGQIRRRRKEARVR